MKNIYLIIVFTILSVSSLLGQNGEFNTSDLRKTAQIVEFEFVKNLKNSSREKLMDFYSSIEADRGLIKQININSWGICEHYNIDNFDTYNYYYKPISRTVYNKYCKELNALMLLDGTIKQLK